MEGDLCAASHALNARSRRFILRCGTTFAIAGLQQVYKVLS